MTPGACPTCGAALWRTVPHPRDEHPVRLWPDPSGRYLTFHVEPDGHTAEVMFCSGCATTSARMAVALTNTPAAPTDYHWTDKFGAHLTAWLRDHLRLDPGPIMQRWAEDRRAVEAMNAEGVTT